MPYPAFHLSFFIFCISLVGVFAIAGSGFRREIGFKDVKHLSLLLFVGSVGSVFPDVPAVWNYLLYGNLQHTSIGTVPTHSLFFGLVAFILALALGYIIYRNISKASSLGIFAEAAFLSHLLLDDIADGGLTYLYPAYNEPLSIFVFMNVQLSGVNFFYYNFACFLSVFFIFCVMFMALLALKDLGFGFRYEPIE
ncbi:metal-dependent hydrolase [Methanolobus mangrovi]|uniref:Metal-dependent hydrolase n=1 Tax=Methanolobus mangrovi TaxID=3072977 RepID=A0AA51UH64_9EURY|nr:metal-dependent hydrolase [Methanolobus mangrovi]WMW23106.1 metal-dependent hydrolase [Methanolobus mangrovi]